MPHISTRTLYAIAARRLLAKASLVAFLLVVAVLFTNACANITALQGGAKDTTPPTIVKTYPSHESTRFQGKKLAITFNKNIKFDSSQLSITPKLEKQKGKSSYTHTVRGSTLTINLKVPLASDTTYTFNFDNAVKDLTEGNAAKDAVLTFSTGDQLDQMSVAGYVIHHMTQRLVPQAMVALYRAGQEEDTQKHILNSSPDYFCYTNDQGAFLLKNIQQGQYYLCASKTAEKAFIVDPGKDMYGFLRDPIQLHAESPRDVIVSILHADIREFKLLRQRPQHQYFELQFSKPVKEYTLKLARQYKRLKGETALYSHLVERKQVIRIYNTAGLLEEDGLEAYLTAIDAIGNTIEQKIDIHFNEENIRKVSATYDLTPSSGATIKPLFVGTMHLNKPVKTVSADKISFVLDEKRTITLQPEDLQLNTQRDVITITKGLELILPSQPSDKGEKQPGELTLHIAEEAFLTVEGDQNEAMRYTYTLSNPKAHGTVKGMVLTQAPGFIVQLLDTQYNIVDEVRNVPQYEFHGVAPGDYRLRLLILPEQDGAWRFGNLHERREPDPVRLYPKVVGVVANWVVEDINFIY
ncbi:MAG: Ig-like domain-containing protein [Bacteroidota bacterium]